MSSQLLMLIILSSLCSPSKQKVITVNCNSGNDSLCEQSNYTHPCKTLHTALEGINNNTIIHIDKGYCPHNTNTTLNLTLIYNVTITGNGSDVTIVECENGTGFGFINVTNISSY